MHIYHCHATYQKGGLHHLDGMFSLPRKIESTEDYREIKKSIRRDQSLVPLHEVCIQSLSYHGVSDDD